MMQLQPLSTNHTVLKFDTGVEVFFSYETPVAAFIPGQGYVKSDIFYSVTTSKHANKWAGVNATKVAQSVIDNLLP